MRAIAFQPQAAGTGAARSFPVTEAAEPVPGPGQLLVRAEAAGVGVGLVRMLRSGLLPAAGPGGEFVGRVTSVGPDVTGYQAGDRVGGVVFEGLYAGSVLAVPQLVSPVPAGAGAAEALALVRGGLVASCILRAGQLAAGESVLVTAAASGTGHLAVQLARALGARRVTAAVSSADKAGFLRDCGADEVVTYAQDSWGEPADLVLDGVGGDLVQRGVDALAPRGRLVAFSAGGGSVDAGSLLAGLKSVTGFSMGLISRQQPELIGERRAELWRLLAAGQLRPACTTLPFGQLGAAIELIESRRNLGRVVLTPGLIR
ncbi:MAG TPA: zinc-binding dehydrogenase [Streptosporangiaceae bacterium]|nr:zinc-binding dehydrogenase [Streptosporangiaceae bacterium]